MTDNSTNILLTLPGGAMHALNRATLKTIEFGSSGILLTFDNGAMLRLNDIGSGSQIIGAMGAIKPEMPTDNVRMIGVGTDWQTAKILDTLNG